MGCRSRYRQRLVDIRDPDDAAQCLRVVDAARPLWRQPGVWFDTVVDFPSYFDSVSETQPTEQGVPSMNNGPTGPWTLLKTVTSAAPTAVMAMRAATVKPVIVIESGIQVLLSLKAMSSSAGSSMDSRD